jgi:hypothetical protein
MAVKQGWSMMGLRDAVSRRSPQRHCRIGTKGLKQKERERMPKERIPETSNYAWKLEWFVSINDNTFV